MSRGARPRRRLAVRVQPPDSSPTAGDLAVSQAIPLELPPAHVLTTSGDPRRVGWVAGAFSWVNPRDAALDAGLPALLGGVITVNSRGDVGGFGRQGRPAGCSCSRLGCHRRSGIASAARFTLSRFAVGRAVQQL